MKDVADLTHFRRAMAARLADFSSSDRCYFCAAEPIRAPSYVIRFAIFAPSNGVPVISVVCAHCARATSAPTGCDGWVVKVIREVVPV